MNNAGKQGHGWIVAAAEWFLACIVRVGGELVCFSLLANADFQWCCVEHAERDCLPFRMFPGTVEYTLRASAPAAHGGVACKHIPASHCYTRPPAQLNPR